MDWSFWDVLWTTFVVFCWIALLMMLFNVIIDVFRSGDLSGWAKAGWLVLLLVLPIIGLLIYIGVRGPRMADRAINDQLERADALRASMGQAPAADQIAKGKEMLDAGIIDAAEFEQLKRRALAS